MPMDTKTKALTGIAVLDIARQVTRAWAARERAERERIGFGQGLRQDVRRLASSARDHGPDFSRWEFERGWPPVHRRSRVSSFMHSWAAIVGVVAVAAAAVVATARLVARHDEDRDAVDAATDSRVVGAIRAGSQAIDTGVQKVVDGSSNAAVGTAAAVAAGSSAVKSAAVTKAKSEIDERVVAPAKHKAIVYGTLGVIGLTLYVILVATVVAVIVGAIG